MAGDLERTLTRGDGAREGAALVAEQLALDQVIADRTAIDDDEWLILAGANLVNRAREYVFAGAGLAFEQHRGVGRGDPLEHAEYLAHGQARAQRFAEAGRLTGQYLSAIRLAAQQEFDAAHDDRRTRFDHRFAHSGAADAGMVGRTEIANDDAERRALELTVVARNRIVRQYQVVVGGLTDREPLAELHALAARAPRDHDQQELVCLSAREWLRAGGDFGGGDGVSH